MTLIYNNVINGETIKFYEFSLRDYSFNFKTFNVAFGIKNNHIDSCTCDCDLFKQNKKHQKVDVFIMYQ